MQPVSTKLVNKSIVNKPLVNKPLGNKPLGNKPLGNKLHLMLTTALLAMLALFSVSAQAVIVVKVDGGESRAQPIAVAEFVPDTADPVDVGSVVANDLSLSGYFAPLPRSAVNALGKPKPGDPVNFISWKLAKAEHLVVGRVTEREGQRVIEFELIDIIGQERLLAKRVPMPTGSERAAAHRVSDIIYEKLTGNRGYFNTRIAYVTENRTDDDSRLYRLNVSDVDGENEKVVLESVEPILSPTWSPDGQSLAYVSFERRKPEVWVQNLSNERRKVIAEKPGINGAPAFSPDGSNLALAMSYNGSLDIYIMSVTTGSLQQITKDLSIDTEPSWSPDGQKIVFTSDRSGRQQVYEYDLASRSTRRLTFSGRENAHARYSPSGKELVIEHFDDGYKIATFDIATGNTKVITPGKLDESPSYSPDGTVVVYASIQADRSYLVITPTTGEQGGFQLQNSTGHVREAAWSPYLNKF